MAIEFDCPYCTATIRVPDAYGGQQGRCPKCDTRLLVPMVVRPGSATLPNVAGAPDGSFAPGLTRDLSPPTDEFAIKPVAPVTTSRRRPARRRPSRALVIGMPVLCFLVLLGVIGYSLIDSLPELSGEMTAGRLADNSLPRVTIPWSDTELPPEDLATLQEFLTMTPEILASQVMTCRLIGSDEGIQVQLTAGPENDWYAVDTTTSKPLALWVRKERTRLNIQRTGLMRKNLIEYCKDKLAQIGGEAIAIDAISVRNNVGINALGGALSFVVEAKIDNRLIPCVGEDGKGNLYFCLPKGTQTFQIIGRTLPDRSKPFGGEYTVIVGSVTPAPPKSVKPGDDKEPTKSMNNDDAEKSEEKTSNEKKSEGEMAPESDTSSEEMMDSDPTDEKPKMDGKKSSGKSMESESMEPGGMKKKMSE